MAVFGAAVARLPVTGSVALGAALRAAGACDDSPEQIVEQMISSMDMETVRPEPAAGRVYESTKKQFAGLLEQLLAQ